MAHSKTMEDVDIMANNPVTVLKENADQKTTGIGMQAVVVDPTVILHIHVGNTGCVPIRANTEGPQNRAAKRTHYVVTRYMVVIETAPDRLGRYLLIKIM